MFRSLAAAMLMVAISSGASADLEDDCVQDDDVALKIRACEQVIAGGAAGDPGLAWAHNNLGVAYHRQGENERALDYYSDAIALNAGNALYYNNRGNVRLDLGQYQEALADFNAAIELEPDVADHYDGLGDARYWLGDYAASVKDYSKALLRDPNNAAILNDRGYSYYVMGQLDPAIADFTSAIGIDPDYAYPYWNRGDIHLDRGEYDRAMPDLDRAVELGIEDAALLNSRAWTAYVGSFDLNQALADAERSLELRPDDAHTLDTRAHVLAALGQTKQALAAFEQAIAAGGAEFVSTYESALVDHGHDPGAVDDTWDDAARQALLACLAARCRLVE